MGGQGCGWSFYFASRCGEIIAVPVKCQATNEMGQTIQTILATDPASGRVTRVELTRQGRELADCAMRASPDKTAASAVGKSACKNLYPSCCSREGITRWLDSSNAS